MHLEWQNLVRRKFGPNSEMPLEDLVPNSPIVAQTYVDREWGLFFTAGLWSVAVHSRGFSMAQLQLRLRKGSLHCSPRSLRLFDACTAYCVGAMGLCVPRAPTATPRELATDLSTPGPPLARVCGAEFRRSKVHPLQPPPPPPLCHLNFYLEANCHNAPRHTRAHTPTDADCCLARLPPEFSWAPQPAPEKATRPKKVTCSACAAVLQ